MNSRFPEGAAQTLKPVVAYYRVSTDRQGRSGLGLEAQQATVAAYCRQSSATVFESFTEIESGRRCDRKELAKALAVAKSVKATLVVAKLDRLARNVSFTAKLLDAEVDFLACDNPHATKLTIHILAAVAEDEAERISTRVKEALAAYKARGGVLGGQDPRCRGKSTNEKLRERSLLARDENRRRAGEFRKAIRPVAAGLRRDGMTFREVAQVLNARGYHTRHGKLWTPANVDVLLRVATWEKS